MPMVAGSLAEFHSAKVELKVVEKHDGLFGGDFIEIGEGFDWAAGKVHEAAGGGE